MGYFENTVIIIGIILNIAGGVLASAYILKCCIDKFNQEEVFRAFISQIRLCFFWGIILMAFGWLISAKGSGSIVSIGLEINIIMWTVLFLVSILLMLPFIKKLNPEISQDYVIHLKDVSVISITFSFISIVLYWFVY